MHSLFMPNKEVFNYNINHDWTGGILVDFIKIVDNCPNSASRNVQPAPSSHHKDRRLSGLVFDKLSPNDYLYNCDTVGGSYYSPADCQWHDCSKPQMMAIYIRSTD